MTIADIARAADVPVESVLRVISRDEVSSDVAARVRDAMKRYGYDRMPQLFGDRGPADALGRVRQRLQDDVDEAVTESENAGSGDSQPDAVAVGAVVDRMDRMAAIDELLHRLAQDVDEIKLELRRARSERLEDMTLIVDLIMTSWRGVDRRLSRIDRTLERFEGSREGGRWSRLP
jgi:hypothetical protein